MKIRRAEEKDVARIVEHNRAMAMETENKELDVETLERGVRAMLYATDHGWYWVYERDGEVVGQLMITREWSDWRNAFFWWIQSVYVREEARRTGVYRALHDHVIACAKKSGVCGVRLYVERDNANARTTYESLGMQQSDYVMFEQSC